MQVIFYAPNKYQSADRLRVLLEGRFETGEVETDRSLGALIQRLRKSGIEADIVILMPESRIELHEFYTALGESRDLRLVLVLPDREDETIAMAHKLRPRFIAYADGDYSDLTQVLHKMLKHSS
jgi:hypothetical protein